MSNQKPSVQDSLGDRMKSYEDCYRFSLTPRTPIIVRVDGRAFHTFTKGLDKPYDMDLISFMIWSAKFVAQQMSGFKMAYVQSDEASFVLSDYDDINTQGWFDYNKSKIETISASAMTAHFNWEVKSSDRQDKFGKKQLAMFDARAYNIPENEISNYFLWRQKDWERNSLSMLARAYFSAKELHGKNRTNMHDMLHTKGVNWATFDSKVKNGTYLDNKMNEITDIAPNYSQIEQLRVKCFTKETVEAVATVEKSQEASEKK